MKMSVLLGMEPSAFESKVSYAYPYTTETEVLVQKKFCMQFYRVGDVTTPSPQIITMVLKNLL